jgi:hypothetical protein
MLQLPLRLLITMQWLLAPQAPYAAAYNMFTSLIACIVSTAALFAAAICAYTAVKMGAKDTSISITRLAELQRATNHRRVSLVLLYQQPALCCTDCCKGLCKAAARAHTHTHCITKALCVSHCLTALYSMYLSSNLYVWCAHLISATTAAATANVSILC